MVKKTGQTQGNANGTPSDPKTSSDASASSDFGDGGTGKQQFLGRFDSEEAAKTHLEKLEDSNKKNYADLQRAMGVINQLQGISGFVELNPETGLYDLRPDIKAKIAGGGPGGKVATEALREELKNKFISKAGDDAPGALVDTIIEAATTIAESMVGSVRTEVGGIQGDTMMALFLGERPEYEPLLPHAKAWMKRNLTPQAQRSVSIEDVFEVVKNNLKRSGRLEATGYKEPDSGEEQRPRGKQRLTTGSGGKPLDETAEDRATQDKKLKDDIMQGSSPLDKFFAGTAKGKRDAEKGNPFGII